MLTPQEYLAQERLAPTKSEYLRGEVFAMAGASYAHNLIKDNFAAEVRYQHKDGPCRVVTSDQRVKVEATGLYTYPDIIIHCAEPQFEDGHRDTLLNPLVIVEVLSDSTEKYVRGKKFDHYRRIPTLREYVLVAQDQPLIERFVRQPNEDWTLTVFRDPAGTFELSSVPARIPMAETYRNVSFPDQQSH